MVEKLFAVAVLALMLAACGPKGGASDLSRLAVGQMVAFEFHESPRAAPDAAFTDINGEEVRVADFAGRVLLVNVWATWCAPCVREMPQLNALQAEFGGAEFEVIALSTDRRPQAEVEAFLREEIGADVIPLYFDRSITFALDARVSVWPTTILFDRQGREIGRIAAPAEWDSEDAHRLIETVIEATGEPPQ